MDINNQPRLKRVVLKGNKIIADFKQHSNGKLNLWTSYVELTKTYTITAESQHRNGGITTAIVVYLPSEKSSYNDFVQILMAMQEEWDVPVLMHNFPKKQLNALRDKYGSYIIRDDIVRKG